MKNNNFSRSESNYNYIIHPDELIYSVNNTKDWLLISEDKFISKKKLNYIKNLDNELSEQYKDYIDCFTIDKPSDYSNYFKKYNTTNNTNFLNKKSSNLTNTSNKKNQ